MYVSDDPRVFEVDQGIVNKEAASRRRMEDVEVSIFDPKAVEVGRGERSSMERGGVLAVTFASYAYKVSIFINTPVANVFGSFGKSFFVKKDDGIEMWLSPIIPCPPLTRVVGILEVASQGGCKPDRFRRGGGSRDGGIVLGESDRFVSVDTVFAHIWIDEVDDTGDEEKVLYRFEVAVGGFKGFIIESVVA